ncbi:MAG: hypothetical protein LBN21_10970 [Treponema sp.]|jgi:hypothetical protein|nr:hypothetical protein [Treponema sp.]
MTLSERNIYFKAGILLASAVLIAVIAASFIIVPAIPGVVDAAARRSPGIFQSVIDNFAAPAPYAAYISVLGAVLYAFISIILIYYFFEQTQSPEILFFGLFVISFALEGLRIIVPVKAVYDFPAVYLTMAFRILLFGRYFGLFSLFAASVYAAGLEIQRQLNIILIIVVATLVIALGVPIDTLSWDSSLSMVNGYTSMFRMVEAGVFITTITSFLISSWSRGAREYIAVSIGTFLVLVGRNILLSGDTWISPLPGVLLLGAGTWLICTQLHKVYLWL